MPEDAVPSIKALAELARDEQAAGRITRQILAEAIRNAAEARLNAKPGDPSVRLVLRRGDPIPASLRGLPGLRLEDGRADSDWENTWTDLGPWERSWHESGSAVFTTRPSLPHFRLALRARAMLTREELAIVREFTGVDL